MIAHTIAVIVAIIAGALIIRKELRIMSAELDRLTNAVALIGTEVSETAQAIKDHVSGDNAIDPAVLIGMAEKLEAAAAALNDLQSGFAPKP